MSKEIEQLPKEVLDYLDTLDFIIIYTNECNCKFEKK